MADSENTQEVRSGPHRFEPGNEFAFKPGNAGRPKGSRNKLAQKYTDDLMEVWEKRGIIALEELTAAELVRAVGATLPKEHNVRVGELDELTDDQLERRIAFLLATAEQNRIGGSAGDAGSQEAPQPPEGLSTIQ